MAKHNVFISYSRKDTQQVLALIDRLISEIPQIEIWYDIDGIESAADFQTKIINAINEANFVIFACSINSLESEYCRKEVMYAKHKKKNVIPYLLPGMELDGWLLFEFGTINCITSTKEEEVNRLINDLKQWCATSVSVESQTTESPQSKDATRQGEMPKNEEVNETAEENITIIPIEETEIEISPVLDRTGKEEIEVSAPERTSDQQIIPIAKDENLLYAEITGVSHDEEELQLPEVKEEDVNSAEEDVTLIPIEDNAKNAQDGEVKSTDYESDVQPSEEPFESIAEPTQPNSETSNSHSDNPTDEHEWVDMELPSGVKWATCNIGAQRSEEYGDFFAWGEVQPKTSFKDKNIITANKSYETLIFEGIIDDSGNLTLGFDAASQNWGESWRMPTKEEVEELKENTKVEWTTINGVKGKLLTSKINGKSIFFPASGMYSGSDHLCKGIEGVWWSASAKSKSKKKSYAIYVMKPFTTVDSRPRYEGYNVRPVRK